MSVTSIDDSHATVLFNGPVSIGSGSGGSGTMTIGLGTVGSASQDGGNSATVETDRTFNPGDGWDIDTQPDWLLTAYAGPQSGSVA